MPENHTKFLITIIGPTAIGKTALAIEIAKHFRCEILSCDSRQFFSEMTIGTAVPTEEELNSVKHHFIHHKSIFDRYNVGDYEKDAISTLETLFIKNDYVVLVGGSGLYIDAILNGIDEFPEADASVRLKLAENYKKHGISYLQNELKKFDPGYFEAVDTENPNRMMRALEVSISSGRPYSSFLNLKKTTRDFIPIIIGLTTEREIIYDRINIRVDLMMEAGLEKEARGLYSQKGLNALQTVGYRELFAYFDGDITLDFAISEIKKNTRRFAKRQLTWFKKNPDVKWFDYRNPADEIIAFIKSATSKYIV